MSDLQDKIYALTKERDLAISEADCLRHQLALISKPLEDVVTTYELSINELVRDRGDLRRQLEEMTQQLAEMTLRREETVAMCTQLEVDLTSAQMRSVAHLKMFDEASRHSWLRRVRQWRSLIK